MIACFLIEETIIRHYGRDKRILRELIKDLIVQGVRNFIIPVYGTYTQLAAEVFKELLQDYRPFEITMLYNDNRTALQLREKYKNTGIGLEGKIINEEERVPYVRFAIERNRTLIDKSDIVICYINRSANKEIWQDVSQYCTSIKKRFYNLHVPSSPQEPLVDYEDTRSKFQKDFPFFEF